MRTKRIGNLTVPAIGQGVGGRGTYFDSHRIEIIRVGIDLGLTLLDTSELYEGGRSEKLVGEAIRGRRESVFISTKFSPEHGRYKDVVNSLNGSLSRLKTDYIDLYQIHWASPQIPLEETFGALMDLKDDGKILHIGVSNFSLGDFSRAQEFCGKIESNQVEYNLMERHVERDFLPFSEKNDVMIISYTPLLCEKKGVLREMAQKYEKTSTQVILNWIVSHKTVVPIPKTLNLEHMRENAMAAEFQLSGEDTKKISEAFQYLVTNVPTKRIRVLKSDIEPVYTTLEEAMKNPANLYPSPTQLAGDVAKYGVLKPVRLKPTMDKSGKYDYDLIQGRVRYWAWVIAHGENERIPARII